MSLLGKGDTDANLRRVFFCERTCPVLFLALATLVLAALSAGVLPWKAADAAGTCPEAVILGLRGLRESIEAKYDYGMGANSRAVADRIADKLRSEGHSVTLEGVPYPASQDETLSELLKDLQYYEEHEGVFVAPLVKKKHAECPSSKIALVAYSQGAWYFHAFSGDILPLVNVTVLLGDPLHDQNAPYDRFPSDHSGRGALIKALTLSPLMPRHVSAPTA